MDILNLNADFNKTGDDERETAEDQTTSDPSKRRKQIRIYFLEQWVDDAFKYGHQYQNKNRVHNLDLIGFEDEATAQVAVHPGRLESPSRSLQTYIVYMDFKLV